VINFIDFATLCYSAVYLSASFLHLYEHLCDHLITRSSILTILSDFVAGVYNEFNILSIILLSKSANCYAISFSLKLWKSIPPGREANQQAGNCVHAGRMSYMHSFFNCQPKVISTFSAGDRFYQTSQSA
jgi:hypothetical protein